jgi:hypothetical protein
LSAKLEYCGSADGLFKSRGLMSGADSAFCSDISMTTKKKWID